MQYGDMQVLPTAELSRERSRVKMLLPISNDIAPISKSGPVQICRGR